MIVVQQQSPQPLLKQQPPSCACDSPLAVPDQRAQALATMRPLSSNTASSAWFEPVEGPAFTNIISEPASPPHPFLPKIALNPTMACFCCLMAVLIGTPPIGSGRLVGDSLRGMF